MERFRIGDIQKSEYPEQYGDIVTFFERTGTLVGIPKHYILYEVGDDRLPDCYLLKSGIIKAYEYMPNGEEHIFNIVREGSLLLVQDAILNKPPSISFMSLTPSKLIRVPYRRLREAILTDLDIALDLLTVTSEELASTRKRLRESENFSVDWKISNLLLTYADYSGEEHDGKMVIKEPLSQQMMASMLRVSRVTVARALKGMKEQGLIENVNGCYCICDIEGLHRHMETH